MKRIAILGDIGSGKSFVARNFGYPVFVADNEVANLYKNDKKTFKKLNKTLPKYFKSFPIDKKKILQAILDNQNNLKKIIKVVHKEIRKKMQFFLQKNSKKKVVILDVPLLLENKLNRQKDILIFVDSKKKNILSRLKKRKNFNLKIYKILKNNQLPLKYKKNKSEFILKNNFQKKKIQLDIKKILKKVL